MDSKIMWFGRDAFGRRGLLVHWPTADDSRFILSSVAPPSSSRNHSASTVYGLVLDPDMSDYTKASYWEELPCGVYSIHLKGFGKKWHMYEGCIVKVRKHEWTDSSLNKLIQWERKSTTPVENNSIDEGNHHLSQSFINTRDAEDNTNSEAAGRNLPSYFSLCAANCITQSAYRVLVALWESVMLRTSVNTLFQGGLNKLRDDELAPIAVLFSGGLRLHDTCSIVRPVH